VPTVSTAVGHLADWTPTVRRRCPRDAPHWPMPWRICLRTARKRERRSPLEWTLAHDADWTAAQFARIVISRMASLVLVLVAARQAPIGHAQSRQPGGR
jgi:hypothetical protein